MTADPLTAMQPVSEVRQAGSDFFSDIIAGLSSDPRTLPCKYFYDELGAALFQKICELPEYYITRTEIDVLDRHRAEIAWQLGANIELIGLGTGAGTKTRILRSRGESWRGRFNENHDLVAQAPNRRTKRKPAGVR
jgi:uncharacterized SAM-dependent methyltransferase